MYNLKENHKLMIPSLLYFTDLLQKYILEVIVIHLIVTIFKYFSLISIKYTQ